jgi:hypothetical protein
MRVSDEMIMCVHAHTYARDFRLTKATGGFFQKKKIRRSCNMMNSARVGHFIPTRLNYLP